jgi:DNA-binding transcriptional MerR regulator
MKIGQIAKEAQLNIQTLRYYDRIGMVKPDSRDRSGYRSYSPGAIKRLEFIKKGQKLGFSLTEIKELLSLRGNSVSGRILARKKASDKLEVIRKRVADLRALEKTLQGLIKHCARGNLNGPCPILEKRVGREK